MFFVVKYSRGLSAILVILLVLGISIPLIAEENTPVKMGKKLGRGVVNVATGWLELPKNIYTTTTETNPAMGVTYGTLKGLGMTVVRTVAGVYDAVTFLLPVPRDYKPVMKPEFVFTEEETQATTSTQK